MTLQRHARVFRRVRSCSNGRERQPLGRVHRSHHHPSLPPHVPASVGGGEWERDEREAGYEGGSVVHTITRRCHHVALQGHTDVPVWKSEIMLAWQGEGSHYGGGIVHTITHHCDHMTLQVSVGTGSHIRGWGGSELRTHLHLSLCSGCTCFCLILPSNVTALMTNRKQGKLFTPTCFLSISTSLSLCTASSFPYLATLPPTCLFLSLKRYVENY